MTDKPAVRRAIPHIGDERWLVEMISTADVEILARKQGWPGGDEGIREFCEPEDAAQWAVYRSFEKAVAAARTWLATGKSFYGCAIIDYQVVEQPRDDRGNLVRMSPCWEWQKSYEVSTDGETIETIEVHQ